MYRSTVTTPGSESQGPASIRELALSGGTVAATRVFDLATSYAFYVVLARALGVREFGTLVLALTVTQTAGVFTRFGLDMAAMRRSAEGRAAGESGVGRILLIGSAVTAGLSIIGMIVLLAVYRHAFTGVNRLVLFTLPVIAMEPIFADALRGLGRVRLAAVGESLVQPALALLMALAALATGNAAWASGSLLVSTIAVWIFCAIALQRSGALHRGEASAAPLIRLGLTLVLITGLNSLGNTLDVLILGRAGAMTGLALYAASLKSGRALLLVADANTLAVLPSIPQLLRDGDIEHLGLMYRTSVRWIALFTAPGVLILMIAPELILRLFGAQFVAAAPLLRIHAAAFAMFAVTGPAKSYLLMTGHEHYLTKNAALNVAITAVLMIALIPTFGATGAAVALLVAILIQRLLLLAKVRSSIGIQTIGRRNAILLAVLALAIAASVLALPAGRLAATAIGVVVFLAGAITGGFDDADRDVLRGIVGVLTFERRVDRVKL